MRNISQHEIFLKMYLNFCIFFVLLSFSHASPAELVSHARPIEDDMTLSPLQKKFLYGKGPRNAMTWKQYLWPNATVVYSIGKGFRKCFENIGNLMKFNRTTPQIAESEVQIIEKAMKGISSQTCIKFRRSSNPKEKKAVMVRAKFGCETAFVGYWKRNNEVRLSKACMKEKFIQHELLHVLGFVHMQSHPKRDKYLKINMENVMDEYKGQFELMKDAVDYGTGYDYYSIMQYPSFAFSRNGKATMVPLQKGVQLGGLKLSEKDIIKLKKSYC